MTPRGVLPFRAGKKGHVERLVRSGDAYEARPTSRWSARILHRPQSARTSGCLGSESRRVESLREGSRVRPAGSVVKYAALARTRGFGGSSRRRRDVAMGRDSDRVIGPLGPEYQAAEHTAIRSRQSRCCATRSDQRAIRGAPGRREVPPILVSPGARTRRPQGERRVRESRARRRRRSTRDRARRRGR